MPYYLPERKAALLKMLLPPLNLSMAEVSRREQEVEMLALEWSKIMLERHINAALDMATDPALAAKLRNFVLDRGVGRVKTQEGDEDSKKKGGTADLLEVLAAISTVASAAQGHVQHRHPGRSATLQRPAPVRTPNAF